MKSSNGIIGTVLPTTDPTDAGVKWMHFDVVAKKWRHGQLLSRQCLHKKDHHNCSAFFLSFFLSAKCICTLEQHHRSKLSDEFPSKFTHTHIYIFVGPAQMSVAIATEEQVVAARKTAKTLKQVNTC